MQNAATFNTITVATQPAANTPWMPRLRQTLARRWDLLGVLSLMASCAAYSVCALAGTGF